MALTGIKEKSETFWNQLTSNGYQGLPWAWGLNQKEGETPNSWGDVPVDPTIGEGSSSRTVTDDHSSPNIESFDEGRLLDGKAIEFFFTRLITTPRRLETCTGWFEELLPFYLRVSPSQSALREATHATSLLIYGVIHGDEVAIHRARVAYDVTLSLLSKSIKDLRAKRVRIGECVLAILLCSFYEVWQVGPGATHLRSIVMPDGSDRVPCLEHD